MSTPKTIQLCFEEQHQDLAKYLVELDKRGLVLNYFRGGYIRRIKEPVTVSFQPLKQQLAAPTFSEDMLDFTKFGQNEIFGEIYRYIDTHKNCLENFTKPWDEASYQTFYKAVCEGAASKALLEDNGKLIVRKFIGQHMGQFTPVASIIGGWGA